MRARILIIEDNPANLELMSYLLKAFGHTLLVATDGKSGLACAASQRPDLILCDIHMPVIDGYAVARQLKGDAQMRAIPLIAVTAFAMVGDREKLLRAGFDGYLAKPIEVETFTARVEMFLEVSRRAPTQAVRIEHIQASVSPAVPEAVNPRRARYSRSSAQDRPWSRKRLSARWLSWW
ncbi:MAG: response regulator [Betaproteobacteria bacterium]